MAEFLMPSLGADMDAGMISEWLVKPGDRVAKGDPIAVIDTDKATIEVESFFTGVVERLLVQVDERVPVGTPLALIITTTAAAPPVEPTPPVTLTPPTPPITPAPLAASITPDAPLAPDKSAAPDRSTLPTTPDMPVAYDMPGTPAAPDKPVRSGKRRRAAPKSPAPTVLSPLLRRLAEQRHVDLTALHGTGPDGRVTRADVEHATGRIKASPLAHRLAAELDVDLTQVEGTGRTGAIRAQDVRLAAQAREAAEPAAKTQPAVQAPGRRPGRAQGQEPAPAVEARGQEPSSAVRARGRETAPAQARAAKGVDAERRRLAMRQAIARAMARSKREIPHYYLSTTVDMTPALAWLRERNRDLPVAARILPAALLLKAAALAAQEVPQLNGFWTDDAFVPSEAVHLGVAISLKGGGLIAPALHDAAHREVGELMAGLKDLVVRSRTGRLREAEMTEATITVTNLGDQGVESVHGVIYPPQVALVGFGKVVERPWAVGGLLGVRPLVTVTLAADHRATDGYTGGRFLAAVDRLLTTPEEL